MACLRHRGVPSRRRALSAVVLALVAVGPAAAQTCNAQCDAERAADQEALLLPFTALLASPEGLTLLAANLSTEETIYLDATQAQRAGSGTVAIIQDVSPNILIGAFPNNPNFHYDAAGLPTAPALPMSLLTAVHAMLANTPIVPVKTFFGQPFDIYGHAYGNTTSDPSGNPAPFAVSSLIAAHPFTPENSSLLAYQVQQTTIGGYGQSWSNSVTVADFPSAHTIVSGLYSLTYAILAPGYYQQLTQEWADIGYARNVFGVHYPLDIIGGRIEAEYVVAQTLAGNPLYASPAFTPAALASLSQTMQTYLGGGASSPYASACAGDVAACVANGTIPTAAAYAAAIQNYTYYLTYDLPSVGDTSLGPVVPSAAHWLMATRFPYLDTAQLDDVLATTELPSGVPLDNGTGWARLNLYQAASGYGAFPTDVTVTMNAARGGLNAFDIWSNAITGPGGLTLKGSGTLILAGNNSYSGGTSVQGGTLAVTGSLGGNLSIASGATFVSNGGYTVASNATLVNAGSYIAVNAPLGNAGIASNTGTITGGVNNSGRFTNNGVVTGAFANAGSLTGSGSVGSLALLPGSTIAPGNSVGTIQVNGTLTATPGASYQVEVDAAGADLIHVGGTAALSGGTIVPTVIGNAPTLGSSRTILAAGGVSGSFSGLTEPASGLASGTRFDTLYSANAISLVVTPTSYAAAGIAQTSRERAVGAALDALRPAPGVAMDPARSTLFTPLYTLPAARIPSALEELAPAIYADAMITPRNAWNLMADAVGGQLAARRGLDPDYAGGSMPGPQGSTIWFNGLAGYASVDGGFGAALGGAAFGIDLPISDAARLGAAIATVHGNTWSDNPAKAVTHTEQATLYGQWVHGKYFAELLLGVMVEQADLRRSLPLFGAMTQAATDGLAGGGSVRLGVQQNFGAWLVEPSVSFGGFNLHVRHLTEAGSPAVAQAIAGATLGSAQSTLAISAQRVFALSDDVHMTATGRLGWSHEFADGQSRISASFAGLAGSDFALGSAPFGRDAAVVGLGTDLKVASWPGVLFVRYGGVLNGLSETHAFNAGARFFW